MLMELPFWLFDVVMVVYTLMLFWELHKSRKEREELINRLMAKDYREYALMNRGHQPKPKEGFIKQAAIQAGLIDYDDSGKS